MTRLPQLSPLSRLAVRARALLGIEPRPTGSDGPEGWPALIVPSAFALLGLLVITYDHWNRLPDYVVVLSSLTVVAALARTVMTFSSMKEQLLVQEKSILNAAGDGICSLDREGRATFVNPAGAKMTGHDVAELIGQRSHSMIHHSRPDGTSYPEEECPVSASLGDGTVHRSDEDVFWRKDGTSFPVEYTSTPIVEDDGRVTGAVVVFKDISERRQAELAKDEFTSVVSHELRTPLTSIRGSLGLLESGVLGPLPAKGQRMVEIAVANTDRLVRLIHDILDIERINAGKIDMHELECDGAELVKQALESVGQLAIDAQVELIDESEPTALMADPDRVLQTLTNLISNAVKFSPQGGAVHVASARQNGEVLFEVKDKGRGIPKGKLESIFERFHQVDASDSRERGGTGLGLAICRTIIESHGGRIWVESELGTGSVFSFVLPAAGTTPRDRAQDGPAVLLCDDDASVVEVAGSMLEEHGYRVVPARSGKQALERAQADTPDAVVLDMVMPGMTGAETAVALHDLPGMRDTPIMIMSGHAASEYADSGEHYLSWIEKPVDEGQLVRALEHALHPRDDLRKLLIVEDDPGLSEVLTTSFERHGIEILHAVDGRAAIESCREFVPDLILLDTGLPGADGFEVVDWLRRYEPLSSVPLVIYSARVHDEPDRARLRLNEGTEFLVKGKISAQGVEQRIMARLGRMTPKRSPEASDEREAHPAGR